MFAVDDIYYNEYGAEIKRVVNEQPDRHFLDYAGKTYRLDYGLKEGATPYEIRDLAETNATAQGLAAAGPVYTNRFDVGRESTPEVP